MSAGHRYPPQRSITGAPGARRGGGGRVARTVKWAILGVGLGLVLAGVYFLAADMAFVGLAKVRLSMSLPQQVAPGQPLARLSADLIRAECGVIESAAVLGRAAESSPSRAETERPPGRMASPQASVALQALRERIDLQPRAAEKLIEIRVLGQQPMEVAERANAIADAYRDYRRERPWPPIGGGEGVLREELAQSERRAAQMREDLRIMDTPSHSSEPSSSQLLDTLRRSTQLKLEEQAELSRQEALLANLKELSHDDLLRALPVTLPDKTYEDLAQRAIATDQKLAEARRSYGSDHPEVAKLKKILEAAQGEVDARAKSLMAALEVKVSGLKDALQQRTKEIERLQREDVEKANRNEPYRALARQLEEAEQKRKLLAGQLASTQHEGSSHLEVEIDRALPDGRKAPQNPKLAMALLGVGFVLSLAGIRSVLARVPK